MKDLPPGYLEDGDFPQVDKSEDQTSAPDIKESVQVGDPEKSKEKSAEEVVVVVGDENNKNCDSVSENKGSSVAVRSNLKRKRVDVTCDDEGGSEKDAGDDDFEALESDEDVEDTIEKEEEEEGDVDHQQELQELQVGTVHRYCDNYVYCCCGNNTVGLLLGFICWLLA